MIQNQHQYKVTNSKLKELEQSLANLAANPEGSIGTPDNPVEGVPAEDDDEVPAELHARFLEIPYVGSRDGYQDMVDFIETVEDERLRDLLGVAVKGKGAFGRFKDVLRRSEYKLEQERWFAFGGQLETDRAIKWLASEGLSVST